jgi:hypothetical protein
VPQATVPGTNEQKKETPVVTPKTVVVSMPESDILKKLR